MICMQCDGMRCDEMGGGSRCVCVWYAFVHAICCICTSCSSENSHNYDDVAAVGKLVPHPARRAFFTVLGVKEPALVLYFFR